jgi:hypothetical protein
LKNTAPITKEFFDRYLKPNGTKRFGSQRFGGEAFELYEDDEEDLAQ